MTKRGGREGRKRAERKDKKQQNRNNARRELKRLVKRGMSNPGLTPISRRNAGARHQPPRHVSTLGAGVEWRVWTDKKRGNPSSFALRLKGLEKVRGARRETRSAILVID